MKSAEPLTVRIQGAIPSQSLVRELAVGQETRIGRAPKAGWTIAWDMMISREHADLTWNGERLHVRLTPNAQNPILYRNQSLRELTVLSGEWFQIGQSSFQVGELAATTPLGLSSETSTLPVADVRGYDADDLRKVAFQHTDQRMEILAQIPDLIRRSRSDEELCGSLSIMLLNVLPQAEAVAVAQFDLALLPADPDRLETFPEPSTMRVETRTRFTGRFQPSRRMVWLALKKEQSLIHITGDDGSGKFTVSEGLRWSFCCPIRGDATKGWCLYVSGNKTWNESRAISEDDLAPDLRFTELVAQFIGSIRHVRVLQDQKTRLSAFFSPKVVQTLSHQSRANELLAPAERSVTVLFCDVRGFSRKCEQLQGDLLRLLQSVRGALGVMAEGIIDNDGTIADFQGDAALGFWGWPVEASDGPLPACRAALQIYREFQQGGAESGGLLEGFAVGIGIAHGRALAGQIGTSRQGKVGVFGPVANLGSRVEGLTRQFGVPICIDEATADFVRNGLAPEEGRIRRLGRVRPKGMAAAVLVYALLPGGTETDGLSGDQLQLYDEAVDDVSAGRWERALTTLRALPTFDGPTRFLLRMMAEANHRPPDDWSGAFSLGEK